MKQGCSRRVCASQACSSQLRARKLARLFHDPGLPMSDASYRDAIFSTPLDRVARFSFDEKVVACFPDMIRRSVPGYGQILGMLSLIAQRHLRHGAHVYDLAVRWALPALHWRARCRLMLFATQGSISLPPWPLKHGKPLLTSAQRTPCRLKKPTFVPWSMRLRV